jgi:fatty acid desaturase
MHIVAKEYNKSIEYKKITHLYLSKDEIKSFHVKSDWKAILEILSVWFWIIAAFAMVFVYPNVLTVILALWIIGGKQLGCAIIMHDTSHYSLFKTKKINDIVGNWLGAYPMIQNVRQYRPYHLLHHIATGTQEDPDRNLTQGYPTSRMSIFRKFMRDLIGATGLKGFIGVIMMHLGYLEYNLGNTVIKTNPKNIYEVLNNAVRNLAGPLIFHLLFLGIFIALHRPILYLLWWGAFFSTYNFCLRVRSIAEHSVVPDSNNPYTSSRTTYANFLEKLLFAPLHVNYHTEHHLLIAAPCYHNPKIHKLLKDRGYFEKGLLEKNYRNIIKMAIKR